MSITYIAFIECTFTPKGEWHTVYGFPQLDEQRTDGLYKAKLDKAQLNLVDIKGDRRYFSFNINGEVRVVNNVVVFDSDWCEELAIDESKKFPSKKRIDE